MKIFNFIPAVLTIAIILGIIFGFYIEFKPFVIIASLLFLILLLVISYYFSNKSFSKNIHFNLVSYFLFFVIGVATITFQNQKNRENYYVHFITENDKVVLIIKKELKSNTYYNKYEANVIQVNQQKTIGKVLLNIQKDSVINQLNITDKLVVSSNFKFINEPKNPHQFNYRKYLEKQQIYRQITCKKHDYKLLKNKVSTLIGTASKFRNRINNSLQRYSFKKDELAIINALLLGQRQNMSKELIESYQGAGAIHILAVSGLHIGILLLLLTYLLKSLAYFKNGKTLKLIISILLLWSFAFVAGLSASVIRAVTMYSAVAIGLVSNRKSSTLNNLFISMFLLLLINPLYLFSVGFQLSYLAVFSIVYFYPKFIEWYNPKLIYLKKPWQLFAVSCSAQLGVLPLSLYYFHQFPSLFFISSLVIIPVLGFILGFGILIIGLALLHILPPFLAIIYGNIIFLMNFFIAFIAEQEAFLFKQISFSVLLLIVSYLFIIFSFRWLDKKTIKRFTYALLTFILIQSVFIYQKNKLQTKKEFIVFNKNRNTIIAQREGKKLNVFYDLDSLTNLNSVKSYKIANGNLNISTSNLKNMYEFKGKKILVIDSLGIYNINNLFPEMVLLTQSPKINLERLLQKLKPKIIIADASNYKSYVSSWKQTCKNYSVEFYSTYEKGAYIKTN
ncbi:MAG: ComEC family competence protein [Flavobacteriaceae bacterium]|nr:ComEC family competence protein [Flavobacteriaceae bacterium]